MESTILLAKVFGLFLIAMGIALPLRRQHYMAILPAFVQDGMTRMVIGAAELLAGLFLIIAHPYWTPLPAAIVSVIGWMAALEGLFYLVASNALVSRTVASFNRMSVYWMSGLICLGVGVYLAAFGFGLIGA